MSNEDTIRALLASAQHVAGEDAEAEARIAARQAWVREIIARFRAAQDRVGEAWDRIFDELGDDLDEDELEAIPEPPEQAEADAIWAEIEAVREHDRWPKELHWIV